MPESLLIYIVFGAFVCGIVAGYIIARLRQNSRTSLLGPLLTNHYIRIRRNNKTKRSSAS